MLFFTGSQRQQSMVSHGKQISVICILVEPEDPELLTPAQIVMQSEDQQQHLWQQPQPGISGAYRFLGLGSLLQEASKDDQKDTNHLR